MEFKYPKDIHRGLKPTVRPQPSPSKTQQFLKDLGLDEDDTLTDSSSDDDDSSNDAHPTQIEFNVLQKELQACTQKHDHLQEKNRELIKNVNYLKARLKKEKLSKEMRMKIVQRAHKDGLKDKQRLISNLQELIEEGGDGGGLKMMSTIEALHQEKAALHDQLLKKQQEFENKVDELEIDPNIHSNQESSSDHDNVKILEKIAEDKQRIAFELEETKKLHIQEIQKFEEILQEKEAEITRSKQEKERKRQSESSYKSKFEILTNQMAANKKTHQEKERELNHTIWRQSNDIKLIEKEKELAQRQLASLEDDVRSRSTNQEALSETSSKLQVQNQQLCKDLERVQLELDCAKESLAQMDALQMEKERAVWEKRELEEQVVKTEAALEKHKVSSREKLCFAEQEVEEARQRMQKQKREFHESYDELKNVMHKNEEQMKMEINEANVALLEQKKSFETTIRRLEEELSESRAKRRIVDNEISLMTSQLHISTDEIKQLREKLSRLDDERKEVKRTLEEYEEKLRLEVMKSDELSSDINRGKIEKKNFERQLVLLSGQSDSTIARMEEEAGEMRMKLSSTEHQLHVEMRKHEEVMKQKTELESMMKRIESDHCDEMKQQHSMIDTLKDNHRRDIIKLKASAAITNEALNAKCSSLKQALRLVFSTLRQMSRDKTLLRREAEKFPGLLKESIRDAAKQVSDAVSEMNETNKELVRKYRKEMTLRKKYHNELVELRGNIRVFVRARPVITEDGGGCKIALSYDASDDDIVYVNNPQKGRTQTFELDRVFKGDSTQDDVYAQVQSLVTSCMDGYHVCIFAYGQTGSGKTYTMEGTNQNPGINQRALGDLFRLVDDRSREWNYVVRVSLLEIYNETLRDLLNSKPEKLEIKMSADGSLFVQRLRNVVVNDLDDVNKLFESGRSNRATASTNMNERSSRSHAVLMVTVEGTNQTTGQRTSGKLNLIDLAGSERVSKSGASGDRLKEAQNINRSLSALGDVIHALRNKHGHVPFRNSKLTYLLQDSLSKESKTLMMVQVSPIQQSLGETVCSLTFAQRVRSVELGQATKKTK